MTQAQYCAPQDVRNIFKNSVSSLSDSDLDPLITDASAWIENHTIRILAQNTYTEFAPFQMDRWSRLVIRCYQWPILSVSSIQYKLLGDTDWTALDVTQIDIYTPPERFIYYDASLGLPPTTDGGTAYCYGVARNTPGTVQFTYTAGYTQPYPGDLVEACALLTMELAIADANPAGAKTIQAGAEGAQDTISFGEESRNVQRAIRMLDKAYTRRI